MTAYTVNQLQELHAARFGATKSRNKPYLLRKLGLGAASTIPPAPVEPEPEPELPRTFDGAKQLIRRLAADGITHRAIAAVLEDGEFPTARGSTVWWPSSVQSVLRSAATE